MNSFPGKHYLESGAKPSFLKERYYKEKLRSWLDALIAGEQLWYDTLPYPYGGQIHEVRLTTFLLEQHSEQAIASGTYVSRLTLCLAEYPAGTREYDAEQVYVWRSILYRVRDVPIYRDHVLLRPYPGGVEEARRGHLALLTYLDRFMLVRQLFEKDFEEMVRQRNMFLAETSS